MGDAVWAWRMERASEPLREEDGGGGDVRPIEILWEKPDAVQSPWIVTDDHIVAYLPLTMFSWSSS